MIERKFNLERWTHLYKLAEKLDFAKEVNMLNWQCGTAYCVGGHLAISKFANEQGLTLNFVGPTYVDEVGNKLFSFDALAAYLGVCYWDAYPVFQYRPLEERTPDVTRARVLGRLVNLKAMYGEDSLPFLVDELEEVEP